MAKAESTVRNNLDCLNVDFMRSLVKQYTELGQWTSAFFWADAAAASSGAAVASGDDVWLLASAMLARGELHRAAHAITSRNLHRRHLLCLGVAMRAYISVKEPQTTLSILEECDPNLLEPRSMDQTHNRALAGVLVWQARALCLLERREAAAEALTAALRADAACYEALDLLLDQHALTPGQEIELIESLPVNNQMSASEATLVRVAYRERLLRYTPLQTASPDSYNNQIKTAVELARSRSAEAAESRGRRLAAGGRWGEALRALDEAGPWSCAEVRAACLVELKRSSELFAFAHALVDSYPQAWTAWYAVGCYYYLIGKSEFARRYLSKACSLEAGAGCVWLAYGHSFAADNEHDQAMAAYFKASQLMPGCYLPSLYVGVECSLLNNVSMCERFMSRAASLHSNAELAYKTFIIANDKFCLTVTQEDVDFDIRTLRVLRDDYPYETVMSQGTDSVGIETDIEQRGGWERVCRVVRSPHVAHEAAAAALAAGHPEHARVLFTRALHYAGPPDQLNPCWATTLDALGHVNRVLGNPSEALQWHERALALRPARASTLAAKGLCLALLGREPEAADTLHAALARDPDHVVAIALLDAIIDRLDAQLTEEEIPQFAFPAVSLSSPPAPPAASGDFAPSPAAPAGRTDATNTSDMSMSFD
ncbi:Cell division cycle protein 16 [Danaus plexippus plexippus]|uniref:Cell division cycle protein 16 n=1 Tax=Danaus plexippus plexippus TaxID=278856 RepID=A0A212EXC2_DANPL|nr:Cell division cycle protein 16 [Danaus plexippus plexippus]